MAESLDSPEDFLPFHLCDDLVCCVVCYEPFTETRVPKALPCLHSFCKTCLAACIQSYQTQKRSRQRHSDKKNAKGEFPCPICKDVIKIPANGLDGFRDDFRIRRISEVISKSREIIRNSSSENLLEHLPGVEEGVDRCDVCRLSRVDRAAHRYCLDCFKMLCDQCTESHELVALTSDHKLIQIPEAAGRAKLPIGSTCSQHTAEPLRYYCKDCQHALCVTCSIEVDHKSHEMTRLSEEVTSMKEDTTSVLGETWKEVFDAERRLEEIDSLDRELKAKEISVKRAILSKTLEEIFRARQRQHRMEQDLEEMCSAKVKLLQAKRKSYNEFTDTARNQCAFVESILDHGHDLHIVHTTQQYIPPIKTLVKDGLPTMASLNKLTDLGKYDTFLTELYDAKEATSEDSQESILAEIRSVVSEIRQLSTSQAKPESKAKKGLELIKKIGRKGEAEGEFSFPSGITFLPTGELVVADMHNHRIQIFDKSGEFCRSFGAPSLKPCGVTLTPDNDLAVTDCTTDKGAIKVFSARGELKQTLAEGQVEYPFSVAIDSNRRFIVCDSATNRIVVLKENGDLSRRFTTRTKFAFYLAVSHKDEILLSDWFNHCVKVFDSNGILLRTIGSKGTKDGQIMIPLGLCLTKENNVMILDCKCGRVSLFTPEGKFVKHVVGQNGGIEYSRAIAVSDQGLLAISSGDNRGHIPNEVRLYQCNE